MAVSAEEDADDFAIPTTDNASVRDICLDTSTPPAMGRLHSDFVSPFASLVCCSLSCYNEQGRSFFKDCSIFHEIPGEFKVQIHTSYTSYIR